MGSKKKKIRCGVCGVIATRSLSSADHICDNPVCEQVTRHHMEVAVAYMAAVEEKEEKYKEGAQP